MAFNPEIHQVKLIIIRCGHAIREATGLPKENNITTLYRDTSALLGIEMIETHTGQADHLPSVSESMADIGIPNMECPSCKKKTFQIFGLCPTCKDSEEGKYKTKFECSECHYSEKSEKHMVRWLQEMGIDFGNQSKKSLGIKTITDKGVK